MQPRANTPVELKPPHALDMAAVYEESMRLLARPFPSVKLPRWGLFNQIVGGFRMREYSILCAPTGCGKTTLLANISGQLLDQGVAHFVMSVETGHHDYMNRVISARSGVDVNTGDPVPETILRQIHQEHGETFLKKGKLQFSLYENRVPIEQLVHDLTWMFKNRGCRIAFIDNLNFFMSPVRASEWNMEMDRVTHELIMLVKRLDLHIVMVMHPNKANQRVEHEFDIKGSSTAVQEAQNIFLMNRPREEDLQSGALRRSDRELLINKMRRRGRYAGHKIIFTCQEATYSEASVCPP